MSTNTPAITRIVFALQPLPACTIRNLHWPLPSLPQATECKHPEPAVSE
jgi:hypothetical protein